MPAQPAGGLHEQNANAAIARWLNTVGRHWQANGDRTGVILGSNQRPDIVITQGGRMPVIIECEFDDKSNPAITDASSRLGQTLVNETRPFTEIIAVGIAAQCKQDSDEGFTQRLQNNELIFTIQLVSQATVKARVKENGKVKETEKEIVKVWPAKPLPATPNDLIAYCEYAQVPQKLIISESGKVADMIKAAGGKLLTSIKRTADAAKTLEALRRITGVEQDQWSAHTACAIWLIALDLQNDLAQYNNNLRVRNLQTTAALIKNAPLNQLTAHDILDQWRIIAQVNYLPVIELAIDSLNTGAMGDSLDDVLAQLDELRRQLNALHAKHIYNFAGELWQELVPDREERAAHYTKPEVAELLATLAAVRFDNRNVKELASLNIMDAASGTGTLLGAGERALRRHYTAKGGRDSDIHKQRMESHIYAMDVNGIAGTLTAKRLTDMNVEQDYSSSNIAVITHPAGALILLDPTITGVSEVLGYRNATPTKGIGGELGYFHIGLEGIDWSLMNPPYNRPRKGRQQATRGLAKPRAAAKKRKYLMSHGQAGLASDFGNLSNIRLAPGGVYSHVLPLTAAHAGSWKSWRAEIEKDFQNIIAITNVAASELQSMSADTGMSEMLLVATKRNQRPNQWRPVEILCVNLNAAPSTLAEGYALAQEIAAIPGTSEQGFLINGSYTRTRQTEAGFPWGAIGNRNNELTSANAAFLEGKAYNPLSLTTYALNLPMTTLGKIANTGPTHDLIGHPKDGDGRGAFEWIPMYELPVEPAQQSMWQANWKKQIKIITKPTHGGSVVNPDLATEMVKNRSKWHLSRNLALSSQRIAIAMTENLAHGGRAWNALQDISDENAKCIALFYNSIIGVIVWRAYGQKGQYGPRAAIQVGAITGLPCPAFHADTPEAQHAREIAAQHFDELSNLELEPFAYCFQDTNRHRIDNVVAEMLGLDSNDSEVQEMLNHWRILFASEPNVNGRNTEIMAAIAKYKKQ